MKQVKEKKNWTELLFSEVQQKKYEAHRRYQSHTICYETWMGRIDISVQEKEVTFRYL